MKNLFSFFFFAFWVRATFQKCGGTAPVGGSFEIVNEGSEIAFSCRTEEENQAESFMYGAKDAECTDEGWSTKPGLCVGKTKNSINITSENMVVLGHNINITNYAHLINTMDRGTVSRNHPVDCQTGLNDPCVLGLSLDDAISICQDIPECWAIDYSDSDPPMAYFNHQYNYTAVGRALGSALWTLVHFVNATVLCPQYCTSMECDGLDVMEYTYSVKSFAPLSLGREDECCNLATCELLLNGYEDSDFDVSNSLFTIYFSYYMCGVVVSMFMIIRAKGGLKETFAWITALLAMADFMSDLGFALTLQANGYHTYFYFLIGVVVVCLMKSFILFDYRAKRLRRFHYAKTWESETVGGFAMIYVLFVFTGFSPIYLDVMRTINFPVHPFTDKAMAAEKIAHFVCQNVSSMIITGYFLAFERYSLTATLSLCVSIAMAIVLISTSMYQRFDDITEDDESVMDITVLVYKPGLVSSDLPRKSACTTLLRKKFQGFYHCTIWWMRDSIDHVQMHLLVKILSDQIRVENWEMEVQQRIGLALAKHLEANEEFRGTTSTSNNPMQIPELNMELPPILQTVASNYTSFYSTRESKHPLKMVLESSARPKYECKPGQKVFVMREHPGGIDSFEAIFWGYDGKSENKSHAYVVITESEKADKFGFVGRHFKVATLDLILYDNLDMTWEVTNTVRHSDVLDVSIFQAEEMDSANFHDELTRTNTYTNMNLSMNFVDDDAMKVPPLHVESERNLEDISFRPQRLVEHYDSNNDSLSPHMMEIIRENA